MHNYAPLRVNGDWAVSLSQMCATQHNTGSPMLSNVSTWGCMQYFFKFCLAIATTGLCSVSLMRMHWCLIPQNRTNTMLRNNYNALVYTDKLFPKKGFFPIVRWRLFLLATDEVPTQPVSIKHFCLKNRFFCQSYHSKTLKVWQWSTELLCPRELLQSHHNTTASTRALMVQNQYQAWQRCHLMI